MGADFFLFKAAKKTSPQTSAELPQENPSISDLNPFERAEGFSDGAEVYAFVEAAVLNVRTAPELSSQKLAVLKSGERVLILEQQPEWAKVVLENGQVGWVFKPYISFEPKN
jgi:uncharacterized protein YgiM (DUF1202 family)